MESEMLVRSLTSLDETTAIGILSKFLQSKPELAPRVVAFAVPDLTYAPARALLQRRAIGVVQSYSQERGVGFISCPELRVAFGNDVYVHGQQAAWLQPGMEVNFAVLLSKEGQPQAFDVQPMGAPPFPSRSGTSMGAMMETSSGGGGGGNVNGYPSGRGGTHVNVPTSGTWSGQANAGGWSVGDGSAGNRGNIGMSETWSMSGSWGGKGGQGSKTGPSWMIPDWGNTDWSSRGEWSGKGKTMPGPPLAQTMPDMERWS